VISCGVALVHGLNGSGLRSVLKILTTEFSTAGETGAVVGDATAVGGAAAAGGAADSLLSWAWSVQLASASALAAAKRTIFMDSLCAEM
jgi:hypothetical protein